MPTTADHTSCPYKGLQPYTEADRKYFFGRTRDEGIIISNLYAASVTVFYGASGVGKSSVLLAGAVPRLKQEPRDAVAVVFNSWQGEDFLGALKNEVAKQADLSDSIDTALPLDEYLAQTQRALGLPLFLIFDQFEEYFLYHPPSPFAEVFESSFARAVNRRGSQINFFLSLREDGLSKLDRLKGRVPSLLNNMLRLSHLDRDSAKEAITKPLDVYNERLQTGQAAVTIEPELVEAVLNDLRGVKVTSEHSAQGKLADLLAPVPAVDIETPLLQMVLTRLWDEECAAGSHVLRLQTFEALGRAANIARTHLDTIMDRLTESERDDAANILRYMVTPSGSKIAQEAGALSSWAELTEAQVQTILTRLSSPDMRILRTVQAPGELTRYEIFHDVLAQAILAWRRRYVAGQQEEKIRREEQERVKKDQAETERRHELERARRLRKVVVGLSVMLLIMIGLVVWAYSERRQAIEEKSKADKATADLKAITDREREEAKKAADDAANREVNVRKAGLLLRSALIFRQHKEWDRAIEEYDKAIELDPQNSSAYSSKGYSQMRRGEETGEFADAIKTLEHLTTEVDPYYAFGHYNLALTYSKDGQEDKAIKEATKVLELNPDFCATFRTDVNGNWFLKTLEYTSRCP
jgi:tetratricopeptide (TPR) repeat protein